MLLVVSRLEVLKTFDLNMGSVNSSALHPEAAKFVAGGARDSFVHVFSINRGQPLEVHRGHHGPVHSVSFAPDGETFASGSEDGTVRIWQNVVKPYELWQLVSPNSVASGSGSGGSNGSTEGIGAASESNQIA